MTESSTNPKTKGGQTTSTLPDFIGVEQWQVFDSTINEDYKSSLCEIQTSATSYFPVSNALIPNLPEQIENEVMRIVQTEEDDIDENLELFDYRLFTIINGYDSLSIMIIDNLINNGNIKYVPAIKVLSFLGRLNHPQTFHHRTLLLEKCLQNESKYVREGARLGLLYLLNPCVIPSLRNAMEKETSKQLKNKMKYVLEILGKIN